MKVTEAEWQFDRNKLLIYFTADRRVDFRELVRDLARTFRTRIELKQIGVRDESALLGGVGPLRPGALLLDLAPRAQARVAPARQGPEPLAQPGADLRVLRAPHVLPHV
jgi:cell fate regulator YaaT (PSP1 superfamily)